MIHVTLDEFNKQINSLRLTITTYHERYSGLYGVPKGGVFVAMALSHKLGIPMVEHNSGQKDILIVDDLMDSGTTRMKFPNQDFACLYVKENTPLECLGDVFYNRVETEWIEFFWEVNEAPAADAIVRLLEYIGEDPNREGLLDTPRRVIKAYDFLFSGYKQNPQDVITTFDSDGYDQIVLLKDIETYSFCEHHMLPFYGKTHLAYIPNDRVIGISKLARLVEIYSRRLQIQERLGQQIVDALMDHLQPKGAACIIEASHLCMRMRGVEKQHSEMVTSSLRGVFLTQPSARQELMSLIGG